MKETKGRKEAPIIEDARFSRLHSDPRFQRLPVSKNKVAIDPRFSRMFNDKAFTTDFVVDKRGKKAKKKSGENLQKYYRLEGTGEDLKEDEGEGTKDGKVGKVSKKSEKVEEEGEEGKEGEEGEEDKEEDKEEDEEKDEEEDSRFKVGRRIIQDGKTRNRIKTEDSTDDEDDEDDEGEEGESEEDEEGIDPEVGKVGSLKLDEGDDLREEEEESEKSSDSESSSSSDEESDTEVEEDLEEEEKIQTMDIATPRLALVNLDWDHVRAMDILKLVQSFLPKGGSIVSVSVYPSDFGIQQMKEEAEKGPMRFIDPEETEGEEKNNLEDGEDSEGEFNDARLRKYEKSRLKYFYAVIVCDSSSTANVLYEQCDGLEFERSSNTLDLRFIPDEVPIGNDREPRDVATQVASDWEAPDFTTGVLQYSRVKLTWDDDEPKRVKVLRRKLTEDQVNEMNFKDYVASGSEYEDEEDGDGEELEGEGEGKGEGEVGDGEGEEVGVRTGVENGDCEGEGEGDKEEGQLKGVEGSNGEKENRTKVNLTKEQKREQMREKYRKLLLGGDEKTGKMGNKKGKEEEEEEDGEGEVEEDMEITFATGLNELSEKLKQKKVEKVRQETETVFEAYLRKRAEKKRMKKNERKGNEEGEDPGDDLYEGEGTAMDDPFFAQEENPFDDPFFASGDGEGENNGKGKGGKGEGKVVESDGKTRRGKMGTEGFGGKPSQEERIRKREEAAKEKREEQKRRAELELLLMDDTRGEREEKGYNLKSKKKGKKGERGKGKGGEDEEEDLERGTKVNLEDPRFANLFDSHLYAIDPTDPNFKRSFGQVSIMAEKQRRRFQENRNVANEKVTGGNSSSLVEKPSAVNGKSNGKSNEKLNEKLSENLNEKSNESLNEKSVKEKREKAELSTLVRSLKRKAEAREANKNGRRVKGN